MRISITGLELSTRKHPYLSPPSPAWGVAFVFVAVLLAFAWLGCRARDNLEASWRPPHPSNRWTCIVIHHSGSDIGGAKRFDQWHRERGWDELGYHFVIGNGSDTADGQVEIGPRWIKQKHGAHCKTPDGYYNQHGIGICLVGNFDNYNPTPAQMRSLIRLCRYLCGQYHIPPSHIFTHGGITGETDCPGKRFDVEVVRRAIRGPGPL